MRSLTLSIKIGRCSTPDTSSTPTGLRNACARARPLPKRTALVPRRPGTLRRPPAMSPIFLPWFSHTPLCASQVTWSEGYFPICFPLAPEFPSAIPPFSPVGLRSTVDGPWSTIHGQRSTVHGPRSTVQGRRSTVHGRRSTVGNGQSTVQGRRSTVDGPRSTVQSPRSTVDGRRSMVDGRRSTVDGPWSTVHGRRSTVDGPRSTVQVPLSTVHGPR